MNKDKKNFDKKPFPTTFVSGCCMLIDRDVFEKAGLFDESYFLYVEDLDFCFRCLKAGFKLIVDPSAEVRHKVSASSDGRKTDRCDAHRLNPIKAFYMARNDLMFVKKNLAITSGIIAFFSLLFIKTPYFIIYLLRTRNPAVIPHYLRGMIAGAKYFFSKNPSR